MPGATVTSKGQITIPKVVRERLNLEPKDKVQFELRNDGSVLMVACNEPLEKLFGLLKGRVNVKRALTIEEMNPASLDDLEA